MHFFETEAEDKAEFPDYTPALQDHQDEELDHFLGEIHRAMHENSYVDLSHDFNECVESLVDSQVLDVVDGEEADNVLSQMIQCITY